MKQRLLVVDDHASGARAFLLALNRERTGEALALAVNRELPAPDDSGVAPEWIEFLPPGEVVRGRDGREWRNADPDAVVAAFARPLPIDWEHATQLAAPRGEPAPAAAWIEGLQRREGGAVWARLAWTPRGAEAVNSREYRFFSPAFRFDDRGVIREAAGGALTNSPNLPLPALNRREETDTMDPKKIRQLLGLAETATDDEVYARMTAAHTALNRVTTLEGQLRTALNTPDPAKFVPRAELDTALNRATTAEQKLADAAKAGREQEIVAAVDEAMKAGKVIPATKDHYLALCRQEGGLELFRKLLPDMPVIGDETALNRQKAPGSDGVDAAALEIGKVFGNSADDLKKYGGR